MKAKINGIEVTGTPEELAHLIRLSKPRYSVGGMIEDEISIDTEYEEISVGGTKLKLTKCPCCRCG